jgi:hypothetical protein
LILLTSRRKVSQKPKNRCYRFPVGESLIRASNLRKEESPTPRKPIKKTAKKVTTQPRRPNLEEEIRRRAYKLYDARGREDGHDFDDWLRAEAEVKGTAAQAAFA